jgi:hypothetical protein
LREGEEGRLTYGINISYDPLVLIWEMASYFLIWIGQKLKCAMPFEAPQFSLSERLRIISGNGGMMVKKKKGFQRED